MLRSRGRERKSGVGVGRRGSLWVVFPHFEEGRKGEMRERKRKGQREKRS